MNKNDEGLGFLIFIILLLAIAAIWIIKWSIIVVIGIIIGIVWIVKAINNKKKVNEAVNSSMKNTNIGLSTTITKSDIIRKLDLIRIEDYEEYFESKIKVRGEGIYLYDKVTELSEKNNTYTAIVKGTQDYNVTINLDNKKIESMNCTCPYYLDEHKECKHIYGTLLKIKSDVNRIKITEEIVKFANDSSKLIDELAVIISKQKNLNVDKVNQLHERINMLVTQNMEYIQVLQSNPTEEKLIDVLYNTVLSVSNLISKVKETVNSFNYAEYKKEEKENKFASIMMGFLLFDSIEQILDKRR